MAETLGVGDLIPNKFEPKRNYRWIMMIEGIDAFLAETSARPSISISSTKISWINSYRNVSGKHEFSDLSITLHDPIAPSGSQQVMEWIRTHVETVSGRAGYADFYKRDIQLKMLDPVGTVVELWDIKGCIITSANFGSLSYESEDLSKIELTIKYDNAVQQY
jgi:hypothetical protein